MEKFIATYYPNRIVNTCKRFTKDL